MNPSTLMPRKTDPVKEAFTTVTMPNAYDGVIPRRHECDRFPANHMWQATEVLTALDEFAARAGRRVR